VLTELPDRVGRRRSYQELAIRRVAQEIGGVIVQLAALDDIVASKEFADRPKDHDALPELRQLQSRPTDPDIGLDL